MHSSRLADLLDSAHGLTPLGRLLGFCFAHLTAVLVAIGLVAALLAASVVALILRPFGRCLPRWGWAVAVGVGLIAPTLWPRHALTHCTFGSALATVLCSRRRDRPPAG